MATRRKSINDFDDYDDIEEQIAPPKKPNKKKIIIITAVALLVIASVVIAILLSGTAEENGVYGTAEIDGIKYEIADGKATVVGITSNPTQVIIPSAITYNGTNCSVTSIGNDAFSWCESLTSVEIPNSVATIGDSAFSYCYNLASVEIQEGVTAIGNYAFEYCNSLTSVVIPNSVTTIGNYAFSNCYKLTIYCEAQSQPSSWDSEWNSDNCPVVWGYNGEAPEEYIESWDISATTKDNVTAYLYDNLNNDGTYTLRISGNGNMQNWNITNAPWYSKNNLKITSVIVEQGVTTIGNSAFRLCESLTSIEIPNSVTSIGDFAFEDCISLTSVEIPSSVTIIGEGAFRACDRLTSVVIPSSVKSISSYAFTGCDSLTSVVIPSSVTAIGYYAFHSCDALASITVDGGNRYYQSIDGNLYTKDGKTLIQYAIGKTATSFIVPEGVTSIGESAFENCTSLTSVEIPSSVTTIWDYAFAYCNGLTGITVDGENRYYQSIDGNLYTKDGKTLIQYAIGKTATSFTIPEGVTSIGTHAFAGSDNLTSVEIPNSVTHIDFKAFYSCDSLTSVAIPNSVTTIGSCAFAYCNGLTSVVIPSSVTSIDSHAFFNCDNLTSVEIPNSVTTIGISAFSSCDKLASVVIPNSVTTIGISAFEYCDNLTIYCEAQSQPSGWDSLWNPNERPVFWEYKDEAPKEYIESWDVSKTTADSVTAYLYNNPNNDGTYTLLFTGSGDMEDLDTENALWYSKYATEIVSVIINEGVTSIGSRAFSECESLTSVVIPNSITIIGNSVFFDCDSLTSIEIPNSVTTIGNYAFSECDNLTSIVIPNSVTAIGYYAFHSCDALASITVDGGNRYYQSIDGNLYTKDGKTLIQYAIGKTATSFIVPEGVTTIGNSAFYNCDKLASVVIPNSVTTIGNYAFAYCNGLTGITVDGGNRYYQSIDGNLYTKDGKTLIQYAIGKTATSFIIPEGVSTIGDYAFSYCDSLTSVEIPNSVTTIGDHAFFNCDSLTSVVIPNSVTAIGDNALSHCDSLTSVIIPNSVTTIGRRAFSWCDNLTIYCEAQSQPSGWDSEWNSDCPVVWGYNDEAPEEYIESWDISATTEDNVTAYLYDNLNNDGTYTLRISGNGNMQNWNDTNAPWYSENDLKITSVIVEQGVTSIGNYAFYDCDNLTSIVIPNSVTTIGNSVFYNCDNLTSVVIPNSVTTIGSSAFSWCESLTSIEIPNSVTTIGDYAFRSCDSLTSITVDGENAFYQSIDGNLYSKDGKTLIQYAIGKTATSFIIPEGVTTIGNSAFRFCESLTSVEIPNSVTSIGDDAFYSCDSLTSIVIPNSVTSIGDDAFEYCNSLTNITVDGENEVYQSIDGNLYSKDGKTLIQYAIGKTATSFIIPEGVTTIGNHAFSICGKLTSIVIPNSVTAIGGFAFSGCYSLTSIEIPNSVTTIGSSAFSSCVSLASVVIPNSVTTIGDFAFQYCDSLTSIEIPNRVTSIGNYAFSSCVNLTIYCEAQSQPSGWKPYWNLGDCPVVWGYEA